MRSPVFFLFRLTVTPIAHAIVAPVIDVAAIAKLGKQITEMKRHYDMMKQQYQMVERTYRNAQSQLDRFFATLPLMYFLQRSPLDFLIRLSFFMHSWKQAVG